ncbi:MAG: 5-oxoprolinase subunit PxpA [Woeseiaceae bacterium]|nr:5-oxoprolinase subunit PxpA [Woeseiaceae bacterium]
MASIDLNADLGEGEPYDAALMRIVSSCNVACGGHTGDADSMSATVVLALANGVAVGAHPSYPDRDGFGRRSRYAAGTALYDALTEQVTALTDIAGDLGARVGHVKPHGALYNDAAADDALADILARVTAELPGDVLLIGLPHSALAAAAGRSGIGYAAEAFVDRAYRADGGLVARGMPGAVLDDVDAIAAQAVSLAVEHRVTCADGGRIAIDADTLCLHGDTPGADEAAAAVRAALERHGVAIRALRAAP